MSTLSDTNASERIPLSIGETVRALHFILPVWGDAYIQDWLQLSLASQLATNNLPALTLPLVYHIVTDDAGEQLIRAHANFGQLVALADVQFHSLQQLRDTLHNQRHLWRRYTDQDWFKYALKMAVIQQGCDLATQAQAGLVVLMSDIIFADNALQYIEQQALAKIQCVLVGSFRVNELALREQLSAYQNNGVISVDAQSLQDLAIPLVHPYSLANSKDSDVFNQQWCDYLYWHSKDQVILQRGVFCYPLYMDCRQPIVLPCNDTIDTCEIPFEDAQIVVVHDSLQCFLFTPSGEQEFAHLPLTSGNFNAESVAYFIDQEAKPHHHKFMQQPIIYATTQARAHSKQLTALVKECHQDFEAIQRYLRELTADPEQREQVALRTQKQSLGKQWQLHIGQPAQALLATCRQNCWQIVVFGCGIETHVILHESNVKPAMLVDNDTNKQGLCYYGAIVESPEGLINQLIAQVSKPSSMRKTIVLILSRHYANQIEVQLNELMADVPSTVSKLLLQKVEVVNLYKE